MNELYIAIISITMSGAPLVEIRDSEPREMEECLQYGTAMAQEWAIKFEQRPGIDHNNLPVYTLNCEEI